ncbi:MAG: hypothetical protein BWY09_01277 [Candidatus Hydrogenedentes bacterium ADurb.Bin179]|nr:MAG: hypothetical protein BWY09_01277 [Candidatus Hydrogenedentes bacterium ADurb.Bin179]
MELQVLLRLRRRREMEVRQAGNHLAVHLFWIGGKTVPGSQAGFHMCDLYSRVEPGERRGKGRGGVALYHEHVWTFPGKSRLQSGQYGTGNIRQTLAGTHEIQITVGFQCKGFQHLVQQMPVLSGHPELRLKDAVRFPKTPVHRGELDGFRPGTCHQRDKVAAFHGRRSGAGPTPNTVTSKPARVQASRSRALRVS